MPAAKFICLARELQLKPSRWDFCVHSSSKGWGQSHASYINREETGKFIKVMICYRSQGIGCWAGESSTRPWYCEQTVEAPRRAGATLWSTWPAEAAGTLSSVSALMVSWALVPSGCYDMMPQAGWLTNNGHLLLAVVGPGKSTIQVWADSGSGGGPLPS